jgi:hypothetical protein
MPTKEKLKRKMKGADITSARPEIKIGLLRLGGPTIWCHPIISMAKIHPAPYKISKPHHPSLILSISSFPLPPHKATTFRTLPPSQDWRGVQVATGPPTSAAEADARPAVPLMDHVRGRCHGRARATTDLTAPSPTSVPAPSPFTWVARASSRQHALVPCAPSWRRARWGHIEWRRAVTHAESVQGQPFPLKSRWIWTGAVGFAFRGDDSSVEGVHIGLLLPCRSLKIIKTSWSPQHTIMWWRMCIDYQKLNAATKKDHFPLSFIDKMLEWLAKHSFLLFS